MANHFRRGLSHHRFTSSVLENDHIASEWFVQRQSIDGCEYPPVSLADSAVLVLSFGPFACFVVALILMVITLILVGACKCLIPRTFVIHSSVSPHLDLRRDTYEDYTFPLASVSNDTNHLQGFDLHSLRNYAKHHRKSL